MVYFLFGFLHGSDHLTGPPGHFVAIILGDLGPQASDPSRTWKTVVVVVVVLLLWWWWRRSCGRVVMWSWTCCLSEARAVQISVRFAEFSTAITMKRSSIQATLKNTTVATADTLLAVSAKSTPKTEEKTDQQGGSIEACHISPKNITINQHTSTQQSSPTLRYNFLKWRHPSHVCQAGTCPSRAANSIGSFLVSWRKAVTSPMVMGQEQPTWQAEVAEVCYESRVVFWAEMGSQPVAPLAVPNVWAGVWTFQSDDSFLQNMAWFW